MSAVRGNDRRINRNNLASPYARPLKSNNGHSPKKSLWSLSGLISFLNPFGNNRGPDSSDLGSSDGEIEQGSPPQRFSPPYQPLPPPPPPQQSSSNSSRLSGMNGPSATSGYLAQQPFSLATPPSATSSPSLAKNLEPVTKFLVEKAGQPLNEFEAAGIVDYIQKNVQGSALVPDKPEPFRFSVSPSRAASPNPSQGIGNIQAPRKTLSRNPNGVYRWQGAGSSRPRNRYQSPGFAPRPQQPRMKLSPPKTPVATDTKRRRVGDEAEPSTSHKQGVPSTSTARFPSPILESPTPSHHATGRSTTLVNGKSNVSSTLPPAPPVTPKTNGVQPRIRTGGLPLKPTAPAVPSPLRQTWKESDSPPQASPPSRPTRAADFMTELIKEVTPSKKPDVSNPYQTASPVKPPPPVRRPVAKRAKPAPKPAEKSKEQEQEMSAQAVIEATVPKGTKRSRPPLEMERPTRAEDGVSFASALNGLKHTMRPAFSDVEPIAIVEDEESSFKRRKTPPVKPSSRVHEVDEAPKAIIRPAEIIEPADDTAQVNGKLAPPPATQSPPTATKLLLGIAKTSAPKEPSKLRYSFHADKVEVKGAEIEPTPPPSFFTSSPVPSPVILESASAPAKPKSSKEEALAMNVDELPKYSFPVANASSSAGPSFSAARTAVLSLAVTSLPTYEFTVIAPVRAMNGFNWTAVGLKAPTTSALTWKCSLCELQNPAEAKEKCIVCDTPRPASTDSSSPAPVPVPPPPAATALPPAVVKGFDWTAAGIAPPPVPQGGIWLCSTCSLSNPASAVEKCTICDAPR